MSEPSQAGLRQLPPPWRRSLYWTAGWGLLIAGIPIFISPLPLGFAMIAVGVYLLLLVRSRRLRLLRLWLHRRYPTAGRRLHQAQEALRRRF